MSPSPPPHWQDLEYADCKTLKKSGVLDMILNDICWWGFSSKVLGTEEYPFIDLDWY